MNVCSRIITTDGWGKAIRPERRARPRDGGLLNGYQATSIQNLVEATGINRGKLYTTFGDKRGLFLAVLDHYAERIARPTMAELNDRGPALACAVVPPPSTGPATPSAG